MTVGTVASIEFPHERLVLFVRTKIVRICRNKDTTDLLSTEDLMDRNLWPFEEISRKIPKVSMVV